MVVAAHTDLAHLIDPDTELGVDFDLVEAQQAANVDSAIRRAMQSLPLGTFYWGSKNNPVTMEQNTQFVGNQRYVVEPANDWYNYGKTFGIWFPKGAVPISSSNDSTEFSYLSRIFEVRHKDLPIRREFTDML